MNSGRKYSGFEIAVIGMAGRFPGARSIPEFWDNLKNGVESISFLSEKELQKPGVNSAAANVSDNPDFVKTAGGVLENKEYFDAAFFGYSPKEAEVMEPQIRLFHECSWCALEDAGCDPDSFNGEIGIYAGASSNSKWELLTSLTGKAHVLGQFTSNLLNNNNYLTTRVSYSLNLKGPALVVQTLCTTSLVAIHVASRALLTGECDIALAGGVSVTSDHEYGYIYREGMIGSKDGHCRAFDEKASGTIAGDGIGVVVLKRLKYAVNDRDNIYAVILGSAINNDGKRKVGFAAPSVEAQINVIKKALHMSRVEQQSIGYIETHGSGTVVGDPIEVEALKQAFNTDEKRFCGLGSVKAYIGHLDAAAGAAAFIKTVLALKHKQIPPNLHFEKPNPEIDFENSPFYVNTQLKEWRNSKYPLRAGVSSFGIGGTNAHAVLEEAPRIEYSPLTREYQLFIFSAKTLSSLERNMNDLKEFLEKHGDINPADVAYTLKIGRSSCPHRKMFVCKNFHDAARILSSERSDKTSGFTALKNSRSIVFIFSDQDCQYMNMGLGLYRGESLFRKEIDRCARLFETYLGFDFRTLLYPADSEAKKGRRIDDKVVTQPVLFAFEYALASLIMKWGIKPDYMIGYGCGEYVTACLSGVISLEDVISLVALKSKLRKTLPAETMNGELLPVEELAPLQEEIEKRVKEITFCRPGSPYISNISGNWITHEEAVDPQYWIKHLKSPGRISNGLEKLPVERDLLFIELGPGKAFAKLARQKINKKADQPVINLVRNEDEDVPDMYCLLEGIGRLWLYGQEIDWQKFYSGERRNKISLPTYSFEKIKYPIAGDLVKLLAKEQSFFLGTGNEEERAKEINENSVVFERPELSTKYIKTSTATEEALAELWQNFFGIEKIGIHDDFFELGGDSLKVMTMNGKIYRELNIEIPIVEFFNNPNIKELASYIDASDKEEFKAVKCTEKKEYYPATSDQRRIYMMDMIGSEDSPYHILSTLRINNRLDKDHLEDTFKSLIKRHEILRTSFELRKKELVLIVHEDFDFKIKFIDAGEDEVRDLVMKFREPFDLKKAPLIKVMVISISEQVHVLVYDLHHIISDGVSLAILPAEFECLEREVDLPKLRIQFKDFSEWQHKLLMSKKLKKQEDYWLDVFKGDIPVLDMPLDFPRPDIQSFEGNELIYLLNRELTRKLYQLAKVTESTLFILILTIYFILLFKYTGQEDIVIGTTTAGRSHPDLENTVGLFIKTLALRGFPGSEKSFTGFLQEVKTGVLNAFENLDYPFKNLLDKIHVNPDLSRNPLFDAMLIVQNINPPNNTGVETVNDSRQENIREANSDTFRSGYTGSYVDLNLEVVELGEEIRFKFSYCRKLFKQETMERFLHYFVEIISIVTGNKNIRLEDINISRDFGIARANEIKQEEMDFIF